MSGSNVAIEKSTMGCPLARSLFESGSILDVGEVELATRVIAVQEGEKYEELGDQMVMDEKTLATCAGVDETTQLTLRHRRVSAAVIECLGHRYAGICQSFGECRGRDLSERIIEKGITYAGERSVS